jgi:small subunit ribosomal protein S4
VIEIAERSKSHPHMLESVQHPERDVPEYITFDSKALKAEFVRVPKLQDVPYPVLMEPNLVIEYYSR